MWHVGQQGAHQVGEGLAWFRPGEQGAGDARGQRGQFRIPGHDAIVGQSTRHTPTMDQLRTVASQTNQDLRM